MISLKINNKTWREELTDLSDLHTQGFVGVIVDSVSPLSCSNFENFAILKGTEYLVKLNKQSIIFHQTIPYSYNEIYEAHIF